MTLSSIASKLRALRALAEGTGGTEAERLAAAEAYERLLHKYHMDASEIELRAEGATHVVLELGPAYDLGFRLCKQVGAFTKCKPWGQPGGRNAGSVHFIGLQSDTEFAEWLLRSLIGHVGREAMAFILDGAVGGTFKGDVEAFSQAAAHRINERLKAACAPDAPGTALVVVRSKLIDEEFAKLGIRLQSVHHSISGRDHALAAGLRAGDKASFAKPTSYNRPLQIGKE